MGKIIASNSKFENLRWTPYYYRQRQFLKYTLPLGRQKDFISHTGTGRPTNAIKAFKNRR